MFRVNDIDAWICHGDDLTALITYAAKSSIEHPNPDSSLSIESHFYNSILMADSCEYNLDLAKTMWLTKARWTKLIREYIDPDLLQLFIGNAQRIITGDSRKGAATNMLFKSPFQNVEGKKHRWGGCLMGATFKGDPKKGPTPTLTFYSRTTYIGYMAFLDACIAHVMAREITKGTDFTPADIGFRWHITSQQIHFFKSMGFIFSQPDLKRYVERMIHAKRAIGRSPTWVGIIKWFRHFHKVLEEHGPEKAASAEGCIYGPLRRLIKRWLQTEGMLKSKFPKSFYPNELDFSKLEGK